MANGEVYTFHGCRESEGPRIRASGRLAPAFVAGGTRKLIFDRLPVEAVLAQYPAFKFHHRNASPVGLEKAGNPVDIEYLYPGTPANQRQQSVKQQFAQVAARPAVNAKSLHAVIRFRQRGQLRRREGCRVR